jgi:hypothetical protein
VVPTSEGWDGENDAPILLLQDEGVIARIEPRHDDMAALDQPDAALAPGIGQVAQRFGHPWPGGVDHRARAQWGPASAGAGCAGWGKVHLHASPATRASSRCRDGGPRAAASIALSTTSRASSTQASE